MSTVHSLDAPPERHRTVVQRELRRARRCDGCAMSIRKGESAIVVIEAGAPPNRVYHEICGKSAEVRIDGEDE